MTSTTNLFEESYLYLTTTGRKTGNPYEIEIWFVEFGGNLYMVSQSYDRSDWVRNLVKEPRVTVRLGDRNFTATARPLDPERDAEAWQKAKDLEKVKYNYDWATNPEGESLPVEIIPDTPL